MTREMGLVRLGERDENKEPIKERKRGGRKDRRVKRKSSGEREMTNCKEGRFCERQMGS